MYYSLLSASFHTYLQSLYVQSMLLGTEMFYKTDMEALVGKYYQVLIMIN